MSNLAQVEDNASADWRGSPHLISTGSQGFGSGSLCRTWKSRGSRPSDVENQIVSGFQVS